MKFELIHEDVLNPKKFEEYPIWASYYEPEDVDSIVSWGIDRDSIVSKLESIGWSDNYLFPVLNPEDAEGFMFVFYKATFETPSGNKFKGYVINSGYAIRVYCSGEEFGFNLNLTEFARESETKLIKTSKVKDKTIFPLKFKIESINKEATFNIED